ncbi:MAG: hypothetical protein QXE31_01470 [Candidatus Woesearchaeota archaeon]
MIKKKFFKRSQLSIEFIYMITAGVLFLIVFTIIFSDIYKDVYNEKMDKLFFDFGTSIQNEFLLAENVNLGYERIIFIPDRLENFDYDLWNNERMFFLNYSGKTIAFQIPFVIGNLKKGYNTLYNNGTIVIKN